MENPTAKTIANSDLRSQSFRRITKLQLIEYEKIYNVHACSKWLLLLRGELMTEHLARIPASDGQMLFDRVCFFC